MNTSTRVVTALIAVLLSAPGIVTAQATSTSSGQAYPSKPLRIIIPFPPGAATDITGRYVAQKLGEALGQQAVPDNRPGANGTIGLELAAKAPPDAQKRIGALGAEIETNAPGEFAAYIKSEQAKWGQAIKDSGARVD